MANHVPSREGASPVRPSGLAPPSAVVGRGEGKGEVRTPRASSSPAPATSSTTSGRHINGFPGHVDVEAGPSRLPPPTPEKQGGIKEEPKPWDLSSPSGDMGAGRRKRKWTMMGYREDEQAEMEARHSALSLSLALDQASTLYPDPPTPFKSYEDVINRLLPYHVWQIHDGELESRQRSEEEVAKKEMDEKIEAEMLLRRVEGLHNRFWKVRRREGTQPGPVPSYIHLMRLSQAEQRDGFNDLTAQMRNRQDERGRIEASNRRLQVLIAERRRALSLASTPSGSGAPGSPARPPQPGVRPPIPPQGGIGRPPPIQFPIPPSTPSIRPQVPPASATPASFSAPSTPATDTPTRGRPRGRPRGSGRSGLREPVTTHTPGGKGSQPASPAAPKSAPVPAAAAAPARPQPPAPAALPTTSSPAKPSAGTPGRRPPIRMSLPKRALKELITSDIIVSDAKKPNGPGILHGVKDDKLDVTLDIAAFSVPQLHVMGRILNVDPGTLEVKGTPTRRSGANARTAGENAIADAAAAAKQ